MPNYEYQCASCETRTERVRRIVDRNVQFGCDCGGVFEHKIFTAPAGTVQEECHYVCPATGEQVTSWRQRKNAFDKYDLISASDPDQQKEIKERREAKKVARDKLAKNYLPKDLHEQIKTIGATAAQGFTA